MLMLTNLCVLTVLLWTMVGMEVRTEREIHSGKIFMGFGTKRILQMQTYDLRPGLRIVAELMIDIIGIEVNCRKTCSCRNLQNPNILTCNCDSQPPFKILSKTVESFA